MGDPFQQTPMPLLEYVLSEIKLSLARSPIPPMPITPQILAKLQQQWVLSPQYHDGIMLWVAPCLRFFGFLRMGEFTVPSTGAYDKETHLNLDDLAIDSHSNPSLIRVRIKQSKTNPFCKGTDIYIVATGATICPVRALWQ